MKKIGLLLLVGLLMGFSVFAQGGREQAAASVEMNIQHNLPRTETWQEGFEYIQQEMKDKYGDTLKSTIYPDGQLANNNWAIIFEQTQENVVQMTCESQVTLASLVPELFALSTPFMFEDMDHLLRFMATEPEFVDGWFEKLEDHNLKVLTYWPRAPRQLLNSQRPVITPDDIRGLRFRVPDMSLFVTTFQDAFRANPIPMPSGEIYTAMQLGTVHGEDNALSTVYSTRTFEQGKYMNIWNYMADGVLVVANLDWFNSLPADFREDLLVAAAESTEIVLEATIRRDAMARDAMAEAGIEFTEFTSEMKEPWRDLMDPVYTEVQQLIGDDAWNQLVEAADATR